MISGPQYKICKRLGSAIFEKCQTQKFTLSEARGGRQKKRQGQPSDYKRQLIEKQKMRFMYGLTEKQLSRYVAESLEHTEDPVNALMAHLETRLDNVVYRLGFAKTRRMARQLVSHGHILVNARRSTVPSHRVRTGDMITVREGSKISPLFMELSERVDVARIPVWLRADLTVGQGEITSVPTYIATETLFDPDQVFEYYSR